MLQRLVHLFPPRLRALLRRLPFLVRIYRWLRRGQLTRERYVFAGLATATIAIGIVSTMSSAWVPSSAVILTVLAGGLLLRVRALVALLVVVAAVLGVDS